MSVIPHSGFPYLKRDWIIWEKWTDCVILWFQYWIISCWNYKELPFWQSNRVEHHQFCIVQLNNENLFFAFLSVSDILLCKIHNNYMSSGSRFQSPLPTPFPKAPQMDLVRQTKSQYQYPMSLSPSPLSCISNNNASPKLSFVETFGIILLKIKALLSKYILMKAQELEEKRELA